MEPKLSIRVEPIRANVAYSYINYAGGLLATLCLVPLFTRLLGNRVYGELVVIRTLATNLSLVSDGLDQTFTNRIAYVRTYDDQAQIEKLLSTAFSTYVIIAVIVTLFLAMGSRWLCYVFVSESDKLAPIALFILGTLTMASLPLRTYGMLLRGLGQVFEEQRIAAAFVIARIPVIAIVLIAGLKLLAVAIVQGLVVFGAALGVYSRSRTVSRRRARISLFSFQVLRSLVVPSLAFALLRIAGIVGFGIDSLVIGYALGPEQVTRYSVAFSLVVVCGATVFSTLTLAILPTISTLYAQRDTDRVEQYLSLMTRIGMLYVGTSSIGLWIAGPWFLRLWAGYGVFPGSLTFALLIVLLVIQVLLEPFWTLLVASTQHYGAAAMHTIESVLNLGLSVWWVRSFGLPGVIAGTVIARLVTTGWYIPTVASRIVGIDLNRAARRLVLHAFLSAAASNVVFWFLRVAANGLAVPLIAVGAAFVFAVTFTVLAFSREECRIAAHYIRRPFEWAAGAAQ